MAWQDEMVPVLRELIGDTNTTLEYSDTRLESIIVAAAHMMLQDLDFAQDYTITISTTAISPDPTTPTYDTAFVNLVTLKASCMLANAELRLATKKAISFRDGPSGLDGKGLAAAKLEWRNTICGELQKAIRDYRLGSGSPGEAIVGPYRFYSDRVGNEGRYRDNSQNNTFN